MTNKSAKEVLIKDLIKKGYSFEKDAFQLSSDEKGLFASYAKEFKYKKPKNSYFALGGSFYLHLQKIYNKIV